MGKVILNAPGGIATATPAAPAIYSGDVGICRVRLAGRLLALGVAAGCLSVMAIAAMIPPSASGIGTHTELGLESCQFLQRTGVPCLSCGYTTSFSWFAQGHPVASAYVQPMGAMLALGACLTFWTALYVAATARPVYRLIGSFAANRAMFGILGFAIVAWGWKILIHLGGWDGWPIPR